MNRLLRIAVATGVCVVIGGIFMAAWDRYVKPEVDLATRKLLHVPSVYPVAREDEQVDDYHGVKIADPYRWLEDDHAPETEAWVTAENKVTNAFLDTIPERARIKERMTKLWNYERFGVPFKQGGRYFYTHNSGLQNQSVLFVTDSLKGEPRMLLDPNTLSKDGTVSLAEYAV